MACTLPSRRLFRPIVALTRVFTGPIGVFLNLGFYSKMSSDFLDIAEADKQILD